MAVLEPPRRDEPTGLSTARAEFASSLARRLEAVQGAVASLEQQPESSGRRDNLLRRLHALAASARVLGFAAAAESLGRAEQRLRTSLPDTLIEDLLVVRELIGGLPALVLRGTYSMLPAAASTRSTGSTPPTPQGPLCILVCGAPTLLELLRRVFGSATGCELVHTEDPARMAELAASFGPDVVLLDGDLPDVLSWIGVLTQRPETAAVAVVVANAAESHGAELISAGARSALPSTCTDSQVARAILQARSAEPEATPTREPLGDLTLRELAERLALELRRGLVEAAEGDCRDMPVTWGEGTEVRAALWSALARIRELASERSEGKVQFSTGPEGGVAFASGGARGRRGAASLDSSTVSLEGRRILVADDDPAVAWFVGGTLRAAGAEVEEVHDGRRALDHVVRAWPELVVTDVLMPGLDGFALCREIKRDIAVRDVPVILLSWKEDLLFRLRELGADADGYLRKEASASTIVDRARELLRPRDALEKRLASGVEVRGRLDRITVRLLLQLASQQARRLRLMIRDASSLFEARLRDGALKALTRSLFDGSQQRGEEALGALLGTSAGRFAIIDDDQGYDDQFSQPLEEVLRTPILRARAAQRVLSGESLGQVDRLGLDPSAFTAELSMLPLSLRPVADELSRGTSPRQLLSSGIAARHHLESLLTDAARRGVVRTIFDSNGEDLLAREIHALSSPPSEPPSGHASQAVPPLFTFQLSPIAPLAVTSLDGPTPTAPRSLSAAAESGSAEDADERANAFAQPAADGDFDWGLETSWDLPSDGSGRVETKELTAPHSRPTLQTSWGSERRTQPGVGHGLADGAVALLARVKGNTTGENVASAATGEVATLRPDALEASTVATASALAGSVASSASSAEQTDAVDELQGANAAAEGAKSPLESVTPDALPAPHETSSTPNLVADAGIASMEAKLVPRAVDPLEVFDLTTKSTSKVASLGSTAAVLATTASPSATGAAETGLIEARASQVSPGDCVTLRPEDPAPLAKSETSLELDEAGEGRTLRPGQPAKSASASSSSKLKAARASSTILGLGRAKVATTTAGEASPELPAVRREGLDADLAVRLRRVPTPPRPIATRDLPDAADTELLVTAGDADEEAFPLVPSRPPPAVSSVTSSSGLSSTGSTGDASSGAVASSVGDASSGAVASSVDAERSSLSDETRPVASAFTQSSDESSSEPFSSGADAALTPPPSAPPEFGTQLNRSMRKPLVEVVVWLGAGAAVAAGGAAVAFALTTTVFHFVPKSWLPSRAASAVSAKPSGAPPAASEVPAPALVLSAPSPTLTNLPSTPGTANAAPTTRPTGSLLPLVDISVPAGMAIPPGKSLVEIATSGGHTIFIDEQFVGRGPSRTVPLDAGQHIIRARLNGEEWTHAVEVPAGRAVRASIGQAAP